LRLGFFFEFSFAAGAKSWAFEAPDEKAAILKAAEKFAIPPDRRNRIVVIQMDDEINLSRLLD
jgi:hypothetical protein